MSLSTHIKVKLSHTNNSLTSLYNQPLSKATLVVLLFQIRLSNQAQQDPPPVQIHGYCW